MRTEEPFISVIMACYNRQNCVAQTIESILNQTYTNFEFIIVDDHSTDNTYKIIKRCAKQDKRIIVLRNKKNNGINYYRNFNKAIALSKGKYIARMDDDDISLPQRFEKQVKYMEENPDVVVLGSKIETFPNEGGNWCPATNGDLLQMLMPLCCPICHPSVLIRKDFLLKHKLSYLEEYKYAEDYHLWTQIILKGGKIVNLDEVLLKYRIGGNRISSNKASTTIQNKLTQKIRTEELSQILQKQDIDYILKNVIHWPFERNKAKLLFEVFTLMQKEDKNNIISKKAYEEAIKRYVGTKQTMHIFFAINDAYTQHLCVVIASILKNSTPLDDFHFYVLNKGDLSEENKNNIKSLKALKDFEIEFIEVDFALFDKCKTSQYCDYITKETYFRYIIPTLKPNLEKSLYLDCDIIIEDSLNLLYSIDLKDNYVGAIEDFWEYAENYYKKTYNAKKTLMPGCCL